MNRALLSAIAIVSISCVAANASRAEELKDLFFGEALYYAHQGEWFEALERLDTEIRQHRGVDEPELDSLWYHMADAEFSVGDFELRYRMHHRAGRAIQAVLEGAVDDEIRNDAAYRLARIHFQKGQEHEALRALDRIEGKVPAGIRDDIAFLRANVYLSLRWSEPAIPVLEKLLGSKEYGAFAAYNLGIAYLQGDRRKAAFEQLERAGAFKADDPAELAMRDKANLVLGTLLLEEDNFNQAVEYLNRVRLDGPFSNQALLSAGWASMSSGKPDRAVVPWGILAERDSTDPATQEAMLALPYAYGNLEIHGRAAVHYGRALDTYGVELGKLNASIESIREGRFLEALIREEIREDEDWVIRLRSLPETPETYYLMELLASHDFQTGLKNYLDLADLKRRLIGWTSSFDAYDEMVEVRREHYEPLLPEVDEAFRKLDSRMRLRIEQHKMLVKRRDEMLTTPRPEFLATPEEQQTLARLERLEAQILAKAPVDDQKLQDVRRLKGTVTYTLETEYHKRLTEFDRNLRALDAAMAVAQEQYDQYVRARQAATHSFVGYEKPIKGLRLHVRESVDTIDMLMARQGRLLEALAIEELQARRGRLESYRDKARYALANSYDRATQAQTKAVE